MLSFVPGDVPVPPYPSWALRDETLASVARLLQRFHDAVQGFDPVGHSWSAELADEDGGETVVHHDVCPENVVFRGGEAVALLDFDFAGPGRPLDDVASTISMWAPLRDPRTISPDRAALDPFTRARVFCDAYGVSSEERAELTTCGPGCAAGASRSSGATSTPASRRSRRCGKGPAARRASGGTWRGSRTTSSGCDGRCWTIRRRGRESIDPMRTSDGSDGAAPVDRALPADAVPAVSGELPVSGVLPVGGDLPAGTRFIGPDAGSVAAWFPGREAPADADLASCVACGLCLPHCPTYRLTGEESASPRGRIAAMREVADGRGVVDDTFASFMDRCLSCRACEDVCPSHVPFGRMMEAAREQVEPLRSRRARLVRWLGLEVALPRRKLLWLAAALQPLARPFLPRRVRAMVPRRSALFRRLPARRRRPSARSEAPWRCCRAACRTGGSAR